MTAPVSLPNGYYLHQINYRENTVVYPGNKINQDYIYDITYSEHPNKSNFINYISKKSDTVFDKTINQQENFLTKLSQEPDVVICNEKSLCALFFYYKRFYKKTKHTPLIFIQTSDLLPFYPVPSKILVPDLPNHVIAAVPYFEDLNIPSRIASINLDMPGWYQGNIMTLLNHHYKNILII
jgi:hypothetical protein